MREPEPDEIAPRSGTPLSSEDEPMLYCPVCSMRLVGHKCKLVCTRCGYYLSCADYY